MLPVAGRHVLAIIVILVALTTAPGRAHSPTPVIRTAVPDYDTGTLEISGANFGSTPAVEICVVAGADGIGTCWNRATQTQK